MFSVPFFKRIIFALWRLKIKINKTNIMLLRYGSWNKKLKIKNNVMHSIAVSDIILVINSIGKKIPAQTQKNAKL